MGITTVLYNEVGLVVVNGVSTVPEENPALQAWLAEEGNVIGPYVAPTPSARQVRDEALEAMVHDFGDGRVIQVRPKDEPNFERAYRIFTLTSAPTIDWVMQDDVKHPVTEAELRAAQDAGILAGAAIWAAYTPEV